MSGTGFDPQGSRAAQALADIAEVEAQMEVGELDADTGARLIARYRTEIEELDRASDTFVAPSRSPRRLVGTVLLIGAFAAVTVFAVLAVRPRDGGFITGTATDGVDLDSISNDQMEAVIEANASLPEVAAMQVALADRHFDDGAYSEALPHYLDALAGALDATRRARALARVGWMSFASGRSDLAEAYLTEALSTDPRYEESRLFLGLVYLNSDRPADALDYLEPLLDGSELPDDLRADIETAVASARAALDGQGGG